MKSKFIPFTLLYILSIPIVNLAFHHFPSFNLLPDAVFTPASIVAGCVYVLRDFAQRELGRKRIFFAMAIGAFLSYLMGNPAFVIASVSAFVFGELVDWAVYSFTRKPLSQRLIISNMFALPTDIIIVLIGLQYSLPGVLPLSINQFLIMFLANISSLFIFYPLVRYLEKNGKIKQVD